MSTGGSVDERIRAVLDLGDSSGVVKALDHDVEKLLADFQKQTDLFEKGQISSKDYTASLNKMKSEVSGLAGAMKDLGGGGGGGGGVDLEGLNRKLFALERGLTGLVSGSGLGRAAGMLESGMTLFGGPAGIATMAAGIMYAIDQVAPKIKASWDNLFRQFSDEDVQRKIGELKQYQAALTAQVKALLDRPVPGTEGMEESRQKMLGRLFNVGTLTGPKGMTQGLIQAMRTAQGATPSDLTPEEKQEVEKLWGTVHPKELGRKLWEQGGGLAFMMEAFHEVTEIPERMAKGDERFKAEAQMRLNEIIFASVRRTMGQLMVNAQRPGEDGRRALMSLKDLSSRFPQAFAGGLASEIDKVLQMSDQIRQAGGVGVLGGQAAAVVHYPTATDLQREQEIESLEGGRIGGRTAAERQQRAMFQRDAMQRLMAENPQLKMSDPQHRALLEHQAADEWRMMMGGPPTRRGQEQLERDMARRGRAAELIGEHPEMTFPEIEAQARRETQRRERALYPERFRQRRKQPGSTTAERRRQTFRTTTQQGMDSTVRSMEMNQQASAHRRMQQIGPPSQDDIRNEQSRRQRLQVAADSAIIPKSHDRITEGQDAINRLAVLIFKQMDLERQGLQTHEKTQRAVDGLQKMVGPLILKQRQLEANADNLLRQQQRTQQNTTGNP